MQPDSYLQLLQSNGPKPHLYGLKGVFVQDSPEAIVLQYMYSHQKPSLVRKVTKAKAPDFPKVGNLFSPNCHTV